MVRVRKLEVERVGAGALGRRSQRKVPQHASLWETSIKVGIGKLQIAQPVELFFREQIARQGVNLLPISLEHAARVSLLPP